MKKSKKTLVTGAGSSIDICDSFLSGQELLINIFDLFNDDLFKKQIIGFTQKEGAITIEIIEYFKKHLKLFIDNSYKKSIDEFLSEIMTFPEHEKNRDLLVIIGKYAIFYSILIMESKYLEKLKSGECKSKEWLKVLKDDFSSGALNNIITFNYDRLFENYFEIKNSANILHVYGTISIDKWAFGKIPNRLDEVYSFLSHFKIVNDRVPHETVKSFGGSGIGYIYNSIQDQCFIMGFSFDFFNVRNLGLLNVSNKHIYGNVYDTNQESVYYKDRRRITDEIRRLVPEIRLQYSSCDSFIQFIKDLPFR